LNWKINVFIGDPGFLNSDNPKAALIISHLTTNGRSDDLIHVLVKSASISMIMSYRKSKKAENEVKLESEE